MIYFSYHWMCKSNYTGSLYIVYMTTPLNRLNILWPIPRSVLCLSVSKSCHHSFIWRNISLFSPLLSTSFIFGMKIPRFFKFTLTLPLFLVVEVRVRCLGFRFVHLVNPCLLTSVPSDTPIYLLSVPLLLSLLINNDVLCRVIPN